MEWEQRERERESNKDSIKKYITLNAVKFHGAFILSELIFRTGIANENKAHSICGLFNLHIYIPNAYISHLILV